MVGHLKKFVFTNFIGSYLMRRHFFTTTFLVGVLLKSLGSYEYGFLEFCKSIAFYVAIFIKFGCHYSGSQRLLLDIDNKEKRDLLISNIYTMKLILTFVSFFLLLASLKFFHCTNKTALVLSFGIGLCSGFNPVFIYQAFNKILIITVIDFFSSLNILFFAYFFVKSSCDLNLYLSLYLFFDVIKLVFSFFYAFRCFDINIVNPNFKVLFSQIKSDATLFLFEFSRNMYDRLPPIILKVTLGNQVVAMYSIGVRLIGEINSLFNQFLYVIYPIAHNKITTNLAEGLKFVKQITVYGFIVNICLVLLFSIFSNRILFYLFHVTSQESVKIFKMSLILPPIIFIYTSLGNNILKPFKKGYIFSTTIVVMSFIVFGISSIVLKFLDSSYLVLFIDLAEFITMCIVIFITFKSVKTLHLQRNLSL